MQQGNGRKHLWLVVGSILLVAFRTGYACHGCEIKKYPVPLAFSPDGKILASGEQLGKEVALLQVPRLHPIKVLKERKEIRSVAFSPDGKWLAFGGDNGFFSLWNVSKGRKEKGFISRTKKSASYIHLTHYVRSLVFSPDSCLIAFGTSDGIIEIWNVPKQRLLRRLKLGKYVVTSLAFSPNGSLLAAAVGEGDTVAIWRVRDGKLLWKRDGQGLVTALVFSRDGQRLICAHYWSQPSIWRVIDGQKIPIPKLPSLECLPGSISFDGEFLAVSRPYKGVSVWRISDGKEVRKMNLSWRIRIHEWIENIQKRMKISLPKVIRSYGKRWKWRPFAFAFSPKNDWLAIGFDDGKIMLCKIR